MLPLNNLPQQSQAFWTNLPFFTRSLGLMMIIAYILSFLYPNLQDYIVQYKHFFFYSLQVNEPESTITKIQLWRIGISFLIHESILPLLISLMFFLVIFSNQEKKQGSVYFILSFYMDIILIQSCFCLGSFLIWKLSTIKFYSVGLYSVLKFSNAYNYFFKQLIIMRIAYVPPILPTDKFPFLKNLQKIPHKYFSSGVFIFFAFTNKFNVLDLFCGILMAFAILKIEKQVGNKKLIDKILNEQFLLEIEEKVFKVVKDQEEFVRVENIIKGPDEGDYQVFDNDTLTQEKQNLSSQSSEYQQVPKEKEIKELNTENEENITSTD